MPGKETCKRLVSLAQFLLPQQNIDGDQFGGGGLLPLLEVRLPGKLRLGAKLLQELLGGSLDPRIVPQQIFQTQKSGRRLQFSF